MFNLLTPHQIQIAAPIVVGLFLLWFCGKYIKDYRQPAKRLQVRLASMAQDVRAVKDQAIGKRRDALADIFRGSEFTHVWQEFQETLHNQNEIQDGEERLVRTRATTPAAYFFSAQTMVETPLQTDYFKHLPGIMTGLGIIGTFSGLLVGLYYFDPSDPSKVNESVKLLLSGVFDAFIASALAIALAMYITNSEKKNTRICYALLEKLTEAIDSLFDAGVGEEYLAALVKASEENSKQTRQLKDSLVTDLRAMLQNLVDTQVQGNLHLAETLSNSHKEAGENMAGQIGATIESAFREPLNKIAESVQAASGDQSGQVQNLLQDVLVAFMSKLESTFGQQFSGLSEMMTQSMIAMQQMQSGFSTLVQDMRHASESSGQAVQEQLAKTLQDMHSGQSLMQASMNEMIGSLQIAVASIGTQGEAAGSKMGEQLAKMFSESEARQQAMAEQMQSFVDNIKNSVGQGQQDTMHRIAETVDQLGLHMNGLLSTFEQNRSQMDGAAQAAQQQLHDGTRTLVDDLSLNTKTLLDTLSAERSSTQETIKSLGVQTERTINGMTAGAEKMRDAAERFEAAGDSVTKTTQASGQVLQLITNSTGELTSASRELSTIVADYRANRDAIQKTLSTLESIVSTAQAEAGMRGQIVQDLKTVSDRMHSLNKEAAEYLEQISGVLGKSFDEFGAGIERGLSKSLGSLDVELDKAVKSLAGGVESLSENIEDLSDTVGKALGARPK